MNFEVIYECKKPFLRIPKGELVFRIKSHVVNLNGEVLFSLKIITPETFEDHFIETHIMQSIDVQQTELKFKPIPKTFKYCWVKCDQY